MPFVFYLTLSWYFKWNLLYAGANSEIVVKPVFYWILQNWPCEHVHHISTGTYCGNISKFLLSSTWVYLRNNCDYYHLHLCVVHLFSYCCQHDFISRIAMLPCETILRVLFLLDFIFWIIIMRNYFPFGPLHYLRCWDFVFFSLDQCSSEYHSLNVISSSILHLITKWMIFNCWEDIYRGI